LYQATANPRSQTQVSGSVLSTVPVSTRNLRPSQGQSMQKDAAEEGKRQSWLVPGVSLAAEAINGRVAMMAFASLAISQVISSGCPAISGPSIAGKEPFCAAFSYDGWAWLLDVILNLQT